MVLYVLHKFLGGGGGLCGESAKFYPLLLGNCAKCFTSQSKCANFLPIELISVHFKKKFESTTRRQISEMFSHNNN